MIEIIPIMKERRTMKFMMNELLMNFNHLTMSEEFSFYHFLLINIGSYQISNHLPHDRSPTKESRASN